MNGHLPWKKKKRNQGSRYQNPEKKFSFSLETKKKGEAG